MIANQGEGLTMTRKILGLMIFVIGLGLTAACSKNLTPPDIQSEGSITGSEMTETADARGSGGDAGSGFLIEEQLDASGGSSGGFFRDGSDSSSGQPFLGGGNGMGGSGGGMGGSGMDGSDSGIEEARLHSYSPTSNLTDIHFQFDQYDLDDKSKGILRKNAGYLKSHPGSRIEVQGHCDERGTNNYNIALGERRAHSTKSYLISQGVDGSRIHTISYGEEKPFCSDSNENCWWQNRRAHFMVAE